MEGLTPVELDIRAATAAAGPDAQRYADAHRIMHISQEVPGIPFPHIDRDRATFFYVGITDADEAAGEIRTAEQILAYTFGVSFTPRVTLAHDVRHDILTAVLPSGLKVDLVARAQHIGGQDARDDVAELAELAA